ncbi:MAG: glycosyltransferase family 4 protein [Aquabacterium sp.]
MGVIKVALVTNIPAPYRVPVFERLARTPGCELHLVYCSGTEPDRAWKLPAGTYRQHFLKERFVTVSGRFIHVNPDVGSVLAQIGPDVVITTGYNPTHLLAFIHAWRKGLRHVVMTDGTDRSEAGLSKLHRLLRSWIMARSLAFIGPSEGSFRLFDSYGVPRPHMFQSHLCADNDAFAVHRAEPKKYDFLFCGRFVPVKNPSFALQVAQGVAKRLGRRVSLAFMGSGELEAALRAEADAASDELEVHFLGFAQQHELPARYAAARVFLFPTSWDPWGVVANEACAAGVPVVVTPEAGAVGDLVKDGLNGLVLPLDLPAWVNACADLLSNPTRMAAMGQAGVQQVAKFSFDAAADGIWRAVQHAMKESV